jgi:hypothetical protein
MAAGALDATAAPAQSQQQASPFVQYLQRLSSEQNLRRAPMQRVAVPAPLQADLPQFQLPQQAAPAFWQQLLGYETQRNPLMAPDQNDNPMALMMMQQPPQQEVPYM